MAAISALMINETPMRQESFEEDPTPNTPRAVTRMGSPPPHRPNDTITHGVPNDHTRQPQSGGPNVASQPGDNVLKLTTANLQKATQEDASPDAMDIDQDGDDQDGSDNDTEQGDPNGVSRKKKGQRFFCTGYPPCNLSFTRSEHLARHIRKHTGERPFQCHCNRRFSRLDNLRQHAQTVHVNEEIPTDSLAATGTRFQRQIRTDRVRPTGRPRSGTMSSTGTHSRGHSRNLSTSSIGSTSSNYSTSTIDPRRRPPPLLMAGDGRPKLGIEPPSTPPQQYAAYATHSPGDIQTPTSATFSTTPGSPAFGSTIGSPLAANSRGGLLTGTRTPGRRLSVPSAPNMFSSPYPPPFSPYSNQSGPPSTVLSSNNSTITSPTSSTFSHSTAFNSSPSEDWRRRTWHPSTYSGLNLNYNRPATSGLTYSQTPDAPQPAFAHNATAAAGQAPRLPGIESFDHVQQRPTTPPRHNSGGFNAEPQRPPSLMPPVDLLAHSHGLGHRRHVSADVPRSGAPPPQHDRAPSSWMHDTMSQLRQIGNAPPGQPSDGLRSTMAPPPAGAVNTHAQAQQHPGQHDARYPTGAPATTRGNVHQFSISGQRVSPEDSGSSEGVPTPGASITEVNPTIMPTSGVLDTSHTGLPVDGSQNPCFTTPAIIHTTPGSTNQHMQPSTHDRSRVSANHGLNRLDALAAVATSGGNEQNRN